MDKQPFDHAFTFKDNQGVAETFVDGVHLAILQGPTFRFVFTTSRADEPKPGRKAPTGQKVVTSRLVMPVNTFADLYNRLHAMVAGLEAQGLMKREGDDVKATVQ